MKKLFSRIIGWYREQTPTTQGFLWLGVVLIIGIILRWDHVWESIKAGFKFFNN